MNARNIDKKAIKEIFEEKTLGELLAEGLQDVADGLKKGKRSFSKEFTCHKVVLDLNPTPYDPELVKATREVLGCSQAVFAQFLGVSVKTVSAWEQGTNTPQGVACRIMDEIRHKPKYFQKRIRQLAIKKTKSKPRHEPAV